MERFVYCNEIKQIVVQRASLKRIKTSQVFSALSRLVGRVGEEHWATHPRSIYQLLVGEYTGKRRATS